MSTKIYEKNKYYLTPNRGLRHIVQLIFFILLNGVLIGLTAFWLILPINQPPGPTSVSDGALYILTDQAIHVIFPFIPIASFLIFGSLLGKTLCGWVCPMGFIQDILILISPFRKVYPSKSTNEAWSDVGKIFALTLIIFSAFIGLGKLAGGEEGLFGIEQSLGVFAEDPLAILDPASTLLAYFPFLIVNENVPILQTNADLFGGIISLNWDIWWFWAKVLFLVGILIISMFIPRAFCRYVCPTGAVMSPISEHAILGINRNLATCNQCLACEAICPTGVRILDHPERLRDPMCINCVDCVGVCDTGALTIKIN